MSAELLCLSRNSLSVPMETAGCIMCGSPCSGKALEVEVGRAPFSRWAW